MIYFQKTLISKNLKAYMEFLTKIKMLGDDFLIKGNMWMPCIGAPTNKPGIHIGRDPLLSEYYGQSNSEYLKFTCSHLSDISYELNHLKGRKKEILFELTDKELSIYINGVQYVIASIYKEDTKDMCPEYNYFEDILYSLTGWTPIPEKALLDLLQGHPVTIKGYISDTREITSIRLAKKLLKLRGIYRSLDYTGEYAIDDIKDGSFDNTVCKAFFHMKYQKVECVNILYIRKY